jgi:putative membrane protein
MMMRSRFLQSAAFAIGIGLSAAAFAQANAPGARTPATPLSPADANFVKEAAIGGQFEVEAGKVAERSSNPQVRQFGARMVKDHSAAGAKLKTFAAEKGMTVPQELDAQHAQIRDHLASLKGAEFDHEYIREMVKDHDEDARAFTDAARTLKDPQLRRFAADTLPVIQAHDQMAHQIEASMTATGSSVPRSR